MTYPEDRRTLDAEDTRSNSPVTAAPSALKRIIAVLVVVIIALAVATPPWSLLGKADLVGYGICHQIPERSFFINGTQMPLCARCSGTYLGAMIGFLGLVLAGRRRTGELPRLAILVLLGLFIAIMGVDGINSYLSFFPGAPHLYEPHNALRLSTGLLNGLALSLVVYPVFNHTLWRRVDRRPSIRAAWEVLPFLAPMALVVWGLESGTGALLYPLSVVSVAGVLTLLTMVNSMIVVILARRESAGETWGQVLFPLSLGLALSLIELAAMITFRFVMTSTIGLPF